MILKVTPELRKAGSLFITPYESIEDLRVAFCVCTAAGQGLFHPSWLLCIYQRMFHSENKSLMREGVCHLLELQVLQQPTFALAFSQVQASFIFWLSVVCVLLKFKG